MAEDIIMQIMEEIQDEASSDEPLESPSSELPDDLQDSNELQRQSEFWVSKF